MNVARSNRSRLLAGLALAAGGLAVLAACAGGPSPGAPSVVPTTSTAAGATGGSSAGTTVTVEMSDFKFGLSQSTFPAGTYTFVAKNVGTTTHALEIKGPGVAGQKSDFVQPGKSANLTVTLQNGSYELWCPVDGHKSMGMDTMITVGSGGAPPPAKTTTAGGGGGGGYGY